MVKPKRYKLDSTVFANAHYRRNGLFSGHLVANSRALACNYNHPIKGTYSLVDPHIHRTLVLGPKWTTIRFKRVILGEVRLIISERIGQKA
jgi:hypothetical protein